MVSMAFLKQATGSPRITLSSVLVIVEHQQSVKGCPVLTFNENQLAVNSLFMLTSDTELDSPLDGRYSDGSFN